MRRNHIGALRRRLPRLPATAVVVIAAVSSALAAADAPLRDPMLAVAAVPVIVAAAMLLLSGSERWHIDLRDGVVDIALGLPVLAIVAGALAVAEVRLGVLSHSLRVDLLLLAPAVAGLLLLWGTEQAWVFRREIAALPLAWPWPFAVALGPAIERADVHVI